MSRQNILTCLKYSVNVNRVRLWENRGCKVGNLSWGKQWKWKNRFLQWGEWTSWYVYCIWICINRKYKHYSSWRSMKMLGFTVRGAGLCSRAGWLWGSGAKWRSRGGVDPSGGRRKGHHTAWQPARSCWGLGTKVLDGHTEKHSAKSNLIKCQIWK